MFDSTPSYGSAERASRRTESGGPRPGDPEPPVSRSSGDYSRCYAAAPGDPSQVGARDADDRQVRFSYAARLSAAPACSLTAALASVLLLSVASGAHAERDTEQQTTRPVGLASPANGAAPGSSRPHSYSASVKPEDNYFTVAVLPDTQNAVRRNPAMLKSQVRWLRAHRADQKLAFVLHAGDIVNTVDDRRQWHYAAKYLGYLARLVPVIATAGNHDLLDYDGDSRPFPSKPRNFNNLMATVNDRTVAGTYRPHDYRNSYSFFKARGVQMMVMSLEYGAPNNVLAWAGSVVDRFPSHHVMLLTHDYLGQHNRLRGGKNDTSLPSHSHPRRENGRGMWRRFVNLHPNVQFTFSGHVDTPVSPTQPWSAGRLVSKNLSGRSVYQTLSNYQNYNSGNGNLRLYKFYPAAQTVEVKTYSPYLKTFMRDRRNQFKYTGVHLWDWDS